MTVRWADIRCALTTQHSGVQFDFDKLIDGMPRRRCSATDRVPPLSYRSSGWPACSPGSCARATSEIGLVRFSSGGHNTPLGSQALNCSLERNSICTLSCLSVAGAAQQSAATCRGQPWQIPQGRHKRSLTGRQLYPRVLSRPVRHSCRSFRPRSTKFEQWSQIAFEAKGSLYITFGRSWRISRVPPSVRRLRATGSPPAVGGSTERRVVSGTLPCYQAFVTARCASLRRGRSLKCSSPRTWPLRCPTLRRPQCRVALAMAAPTTFEEMCDRVAVHPTVRLLFKAKGVDVPGVLHHLFADRSKVPEFLEPRRAGIELGGDTKKRSVDELLIDQATVLELLDVIAATKVVTTPTPPQALASAGTAAGSGDKSQELPAGYWNDFVTDYETLVVDGRNRRFPAHLLLGAEKTLGRMVAEKKSGLYTALPLGEILFSRHFTASKQVNPYSSSTKPEVTTKLFASEDGTLSKVARTIPEPQRLVTMLDAFEANKFAFIFARWGPNAGVGEYFSFWEDLTRDNPSRFAQIRMYWKKASWEMAMALRSGKTFSQAAAEVTTTQAKQDAMSRWVPPDRPTKGYEKGAEKGKKGDHKGAGKGKPGRPSPYWSQTQTQPNSWAQQPQQSCQQCRLFAAGYCKFGASCKFAHGNQTQSQGSVPPPPAA